MTPASSSEAEDKWSLFGIVALTAYRLYARLLSATWLPYWLAMEGQYLRRATVMGLAKLIYDITILMDPVFGLIGDKATAVSHGGGLRLLVRAGICLARPGLYICIMAGRNHSFLCFLAGIFV